MDWTNLLAALVIAPLLIWLLMRATRLSGASDAINVTVAERRASEPGHSAAAPLPEARPLL